MTKEQIADLRRFPRMVFLAFASWPPKDYWSEFCEAQDRFDAVIAEIRSDAGVNMKCASSDPCSHRIICLIHGCGAAERQYRSDRHAVMLDDLREAIIKAITPVLWEGDEPINPGKTGSVDHWLIPARHVDAYDMLEDIAARAIEVVETAMKL